MDNYIVINGKKAELTNEQLEKLGIKVENDIFQQGEDVEYFYISESGEVYRDTDMGCSCDINRFKAANYCTDKSVMEQRALRETLNRLLWRYSMRHDGDKINWSNRDGRWFRIFYSHVSDELRIEKNDAYHDICAVYFYTKEIAEAAIEEIVKPFMKEHPEFVW